ncbi:hypothetical protein ACNOYE_04540 [Nannocystaceae bacterium ST9]
MTRASSLLEELEQAERSATGPPPAVADRMWTTIEQRMVQGPPPPELDELAHEPSDASAPVASAGKSGVWLKILGGVALVGLGAGVLALVLDREQPGEPSEPSEPVALVEPEPAPALEHPRPEPPEPAPVAAPPIDPVPAPIVEPLVEAEPAAKPKSKPSEPVAVKGLAEELALMQSISTALANGDSVQVLALVGEHRRDFPHGQFIEERSAAEARALCRAGKSKGKQKAEQFAKRWPDSIHRAAVDDDCGL